MVFLPQAFCRGHVHLYRNVGSFIPYCEFELICFLSVFASVAMALQTAIIMSILVVDTGKTQAHSPMASKAYALCLSLVRFSFLFRFRLLVNTIFSCFFVRRNRACWSRCFRDAQPSQDCPCCCQGYILAYCKFYHLLSFLFYDLFIDPYLYYFFDYHWPCCSLDR